MPYTELFFDRFLDKSLSDLPRQQILRGPREWKGNKERKKKHQK
jgi:hypothetical protein